MRQDVLVITVEGLEDLAGLENLDSSVERAARWAVQHALEWARRESAELMRRQVNWSLAYLTGPDGRLEIRRPKPGHLEGYIQGRFRPTSLARFVTSGTPGRPGGVSVRVKPGETKFMRRAFLMRLRAGKELTDTKFNLGLAMRLRPGESIRNKRQMVQVQGNLYLLYGPSVDQVFRSVAQDVRPGALARLEQEFTRLMEAEIA